MTTPHRRRLRAGISALAALAVAPLWAGLGAAPASALPPPPKPAGSALAWGGGLYTSPDPGALVPTPSNLANIRFTQVTASSMEVYAIDDSGDLHSWGLSNGPTHIPLAVLAGTVIDVDVNDQYRFAVTADGRVHGWQWNGQVTVPEELRQDVVDISLGYDSLVAITGDGSVLAWDVRGPVVENISNLGAAPVTKIDAGSYHWLGIGADGYLQAWGDENQLGTIPPGVMGTPLRDAAGGPTRSLVVTQSGDVHTWGDASFDYVPQEVAQADIIDVEASNGANFALDDTGRIHAWGPANGGVPWYEAPPAALDGEKVLSLTAGPAGGGIGAVYEPSLPALTGTVTVSDDAQVGVPATATLTGLSATADAVSHSWRVDGVEVGTQSTYTPTPADHGKPLTHTLTATATGYRDLTQTKLVGTVAPGTFTQPTVTLTGDLKPGSTVTAHVATSPSPETVTYYWRVGNSDPVDFGVGKSTFVVPEDAVGKHVVIEAKVERPGYHHAFTVRQPSATVVSPLTPPPPPVQTFTAPTATVTGEVKVGERLTATASSTPAATGTTYTWSADGQTLATGPQLTVPAEAAGKQITLTATLTREGYEPSVVTRTLGQAATGTLGATGITITGVAKAGETLTATATSTPAAGTRSFAWFLDGVAAGTGETFTLPATAVGKQVTVVATLTTPGYAPVEVSSQALGPVSAVTAPTLSLESAREALRLGQSTTLTWTTGGATKVTAEGDWTGPLAASGTTTVTPERTGTSTYRIVATNAAGSTTAQVTVAVRLPKATLTVSAPHIVTAGKRATVTVGGLAAGEEFTLKLRGKTVATGTAGDDGTATVTVQMNRRNGVPRKAALTAIGSTADRRGTTHSFVIWPKAKPTKHHR